MENQDNIESKRQGKLLIMQLLLDIEELKYFLIEDLFIENGKCQKDKFSPIYLLCIDRFNGSQQFMNDSLRDQIFTMIDTAHKVYMEYETFLDKESDTCQNFWEKMDSEYIQKFISMYNDISYEFKNMP